MVPLLLVCAGGAVGSGARFLIANGLARRYGTGWPRGTLLVNVAGSFLLGVLVAAASGEQARLLLGTGVLGGFTTYSSFNAETLQLVGSGRLRAAAAYLAATLGLGLAAAALGLAAGRALRG